MHPILKALGVTKLPITHSENDILKKFHADNLVLLRAQQLMVEQFGETVAKQMHPSEREAFLKRAGAIASEKSRVEFNVTTLPYSGAAVIRAVFNNTETYFNGTPDQARAWKFGGECCPAHVVEEYRLVYKFVGYGQQDAEMHGHFQQK